MSDKMPYSPHLRRQAIARNRRKLPPAPPALDGVFLTNPDIDQHIFVTFDELQFACAQVMEPSNSRIVEEELGKMHYSKDPTYNMRRKK